MSTTTRLERLGRLEKTVAAMPKKNPFADLSDDELSAKIIGTIYDFLIKYRDPLNQLCWLKNGYSDGTALGSAIGKMVAGLDQTEYQFLEKELKKHALF